MEGLSLTATEVRRDDYPYHVGMLPGDPSDGSGQLERILRARIWCDNKLLPDSWCCDQGGRFWFKNIDDRTLFAFVWT